jgi:hypothetical protein
MGFQIHAGFFASGIRFMDFELVTSFELFWSASDESLHA